MLRDSKETMGTLTSWVPIRWCLRAFQVGNLTLLLAPLACASRSGDAGRGGGDGGVSGAIAAAGATQVDEEPVEMTVFGWCDAQPILAEKCARCHGDPAQNGAPFSLVEYADTQLVDKKGKPRYERMLSAIESDYMPLLLKLEPPVSPLSEAERSSLIDWLTAGAPLGDAADCSAAP